QEMLPWEDQRRTAGRWLRVGCLNPGRGRPPPGLPRDVYTYAMADTVHHIGTWISFMAQPKISNDLQPWIDARKRFRLSHAQIQMARELGLNPKQFGKLDNNHQEPWKQPLAELI